MPTGWYGLICAICFEGLTVEECYVDEHGDRWDLHPGECAVLAGCASPGITPPPGAAPESTPPR